MIVFKSVHFKSLVNVNIFLIIFIANSTIGQQIIKLIFVGQTFSEIVKAIPIVIEKKVVF